MSKFDCHSLGMVLIDVVRTVTEIAAAVAEVGMTCRAGHVIAAGALDNSTHLPTLQLSITMQFQGLH